MIRPLFSFITIILDYVFHCDVSKTRKRTLYGSNIFLLFGTTSELRARFRASKTSLSSKLKCSPSVVVLLCLCVCHFIWKVCDVLIYSLSLHPLVEQVVIHVFFFFFFFFFFCCCCCFFCFFVCYFVGVGLCDSGTSWVSSLIFVSLLMECFYLIWILPRANMFSAPRWTVKIQISQSQCISFIKYKIKRTEKSKYIQRLIRYILQHSMFC